MLKKDSEGQYEGFVVDLAEKIASIVGFNYTIMPTKAHGSVDKSGQWNGMIKELLEEVQKGLFYFLETIFDLFVSFQRADIAMADLTINYQREMVVDFTMPFLDLGKMVVTQKWG